MKPFNRYALALLLSVSAVGGCATTGTPVSKGDEDEAAAAPKASPGQKSPEARQEPVVRAPKVQAPKVSASVKAEFDAAVKKWETARASKTGVNPADCKGSRRTSPASPSRCCARRRTSTPAPSSRAAATTRTPRASTTRRWRPIRPTGRRWPTSASSTTSRTTRRRRSRGSRRPSTPTRRTPAPPTPTWAPSSTSRAARPAIGRCTSRRSRTCAARSPSTPTTCRPTRCSRSSITRSRRTTVQARSRRAGVQAGGEEIEGDKDYPPIYNTLGLIKLRKKNPSAALKEFEQGRRARPQVRRGAPQHRRHRPVDAPVREGGEVVRGGAQARARRTSTPPSAWAWRRAGSRRSTTPRAGTRRPPSSIRKQLRGSVQPRRPLPGLQERPDQRQPQHGQGAALDSSTPAAAPTPKKIEDAERRIKDIDDTFAAIEQQKKMEAELKEQQEEMEKQQKAHGGAAEGAGGGGQAGGRRQGRHGAGRGQAAGGRRREARGRG